MYKVHSTVIGVLVVMVHYSLLFSSLLSVHEWKSSGYIEMSTFDIEWYFHVVSVFDKLIDIGLPHTKSQPYSNNWSIQNTNLDKFPYTLQWRGRC